jgi:hypothetical protein
MERDEHDLPDARTTRSTRRQAASPTERLGDDADYGEPINPRWRTDRVAGRSRKTQGLPSSGQEFMLWLQYGGWKVLVAAAGIAAIAILFIILNRTSTPMRPLSSALTEPDTAAVDSEPRIQDLQPSVTPAPPPPTIAPLPPEAVGGAQFTVTGTGAEGLFLRPEPSTDTPPLKTIPEGTVITIIGEDFIGPERVWKHVRDPDGAEGWVASDFLQPVQ